MPTFRITRVDNPRITDVYLFGPTRQTMTGGVGGWNVVARAHRPSLTEWIGGDPRRATIDVLHDRFTSYGEVESAVSIFFSRYAPFNAEPPRVYITGAPPILPNVQWIAEKCEVSDFERRPGDGKLTRAVLSLSLLEYIPGSVTITKSQSAAQRNTAKQTTTATPASTSYTNYTVRSGDTLSGIAAKLLGNARRWPEIQKLNNIRDPNHLSIGQIVRVPKR